MPCVTLSHPHSHAGTFIASLLVRRYGDRVASLYLLDPVCMGM
jgi:hypothetical protein